MTDVSPSELEQTSIRLSRAQLIADLRSGDSTKQRQACDAISVLAENHFPDFFPESVTLIAQANRLNDRMRKRVMTFDQQDAEMATIVTAAVALIEKMIGTPPFSRVPATTPPVASDDGPSAPQGKGVPPIKVVPTPLRLNDSEAEQNERVLLDWIVNARDPTSDGQLIVATDLEKAYSHGAFHLDRISLKVRRGDILGIVGVNASGKTTLLRMLLGELKPTRGQLIYPSLHQGPDRYDWIKVKRRIAYVSQTLPRWPGRVYDNLRYVAAIYRADRTHMDAHLDILLKRYGLDNFEDATWDEISGGFKTRFEIVRALLSKPDLIILDEPLAYLDIISQQIVLKQLRQLANSQASPIGVIITSQQLYEIESIADRLLVIESGKTLFSGPVSDLSKVIDELVIEFQTTADLAVLKETLQASPNYKELLTTETGYIALFWRTVTPTGSTKARTMTFNGAADLLVNHCPGRLHYIRDISDSCRVLFEPRILEGADIHRVIR